MTQAIFIAADLPQTLGAGSQQPYATSITPLTLAPFHQKPHRLKTLTTKTICSRRRHRSRYCLLRLQSHSPTAPHRIPLLAASIHLDCRDVARNQSGVDKRLTLKPAPPPATSSHA
ncbi:hypothetical protein AAHC03_021019 [Spirometra sp. Aus1]